MGDIESSPASSSGSEVCSPCKPVAAAAVVTQKKRKKKTSYKNMMKGILQSNTPDRDAEKDKESLRKVTGGGSFTKVDKIKQQKELPCFLAIEIFYGEPGGLLIRYQPEN